MNHLDLEHSAEYKRYMKSRAWARKKRDYFIRYGRVCRACESVRRIHVHHMSYANFRNEPLEDLVALCEGCHGLVHSLYDAQRGDLRDVTERYIAAARAAGVGEVGSLAPRKTTRPRQSKRTVKFNKRVVPACLARRDTCRNAAPSGSGFCWEHDSSLGEPEVHNGAPLPRVQAARARDVAVRQRLFESKTT